MARLNPAAITTAPSQEPFTFQPLIREILSTRRCVSDSVFIVEGIDTIPVPAATPEDDDTHAVRLVLGDGELCIQALLHPDMFDLVEKRDIFVGCYVKVKDLILRFEEPESGGVGRGFLDDGDEEEEKEKEVGDDKSMVYLILNDLETIGWNESYMAMWRRHEKGKEVEEPAVVTSKASVKEEPVPENKTTTPSKEPKTTPTASTSRRGVVRFTEPETPPKTRPQDKGKDVEEPAGVAIKSSVKEELAPEGRMTTPLKVPKATPTASTSRTNLVGFTDPQTPTKTRPQDKTKAKANTPSRRWGNDVHGEDDEEDMEDVFEAFEARTFPSRNTTPKKPTPKKPATPQKPAASDARAASTANGSTNKSHQKQQQQQQQPIALPKDWHDPQVPLKLTTLRMIPHLPYAQNWSVNVLAIVASLSAVEPSHLPPGRQRTARIADPSTAKQVHLTVFLDPDEFTPKVGSAVLLVGVKNHRFDGGSLKKYASDGNKDVGRRWWFEDPWELAWLNVAGIKSWWESMERGHPQLGEME